MAILALVLVAAPAIAGDNLIVPIEADALAKAYGCEPVADYFESPPGAEDPPYALTFGDYGKLQIAVWCTSGRANPNEERTYSLLFRIDDPAHALAKCPGEIRGLKHIGGLRFIEISDDASSYYFVDTQKRIPTTGKLTTKGVASAYDGVGEYYACVGGRWAFRAFD